MLFVDTLALIAVKKNENLHASLSFFVEKRVVWVSEGQEADGQKSCDSHFV